MSAPASRASPFALRRVLPGLVLVLAVSAVLLLLDTGPRHPQGVKKSWDIHCVRYSDEPTAEASMEGFVGELKRVGVLDSGEVRLTVVSAQQDMATLINMVDDARSHADILFTVSTPALQTALQRVNRTPVVFASAASPTAAGAGKSFEDHRPNVTGICSLSDFEGMADMLKKCLPRAEVIGTLFTPAEVNSVYYRDCLDRAIRGRGMRLHAVPVTASNDVSDAMLSLLSARVDAVCQISDNTVNSAFGALVHAAMRDGVPVFAFVSKHVTKDGAVLARARDFEQGGRDAASLAMRIIRGESPAGIPIRLISRTLTVVNLKSADQLKIKIPQEILSGADEVVGRSPE